MDGMPTVQSVDQENEERAVRFMANHVSGIFVNNYKFGVSKFCATGAHFDGRRAYGSKCRSGN